MQWHAQCHIQRGELQVVVSGGGSAVARELSPVCVDRTFLNPKVRAFVDFMSETIAAVREARAQLP